MKKLGGGWCHKNNQEIIGCPLILLKILFNEIAPKMNIFHATYVGVVTCMFLPETTNIVLGFFNFVALEWES